VRILKTFKGAVALSARDQTYAWRHAPLKSYIEFAGIHSDLFFASEGIASPNSTSALMTGRLRQAGFRAAGTAALIPSSAQKDLVHPAAHSKQFLKGHSARAQDEP